jgi:hypothetical protein
VRVVLSIEQQDVAVGVLVPRRRKPLALAVTAGAEGSPLAGVGGSVVVRVVGVD